MPQNEREGVSISDPRTVAERAEVAGKACSVLKIKIPCLVDRMDDSVSRAYAAWPDRVYCIGKDGRIAAMGGQGPFGFGPSVGMAASWLQALPAQK